MKDFWKSFKFGVYVFALPLVATAAASAHQWASNSSPIMAIGNASAAVSASTPATNEIATIRNHTIALDGNGEVQGRVAAINAETSTAIGLAELKIYFVRNGQIAFQGYTNHDGTFVAKGLGEGVYSFIASGKSGFAAYGVNVVKSDDHTTGILEAFAAKPGFKTIKEILATRLPSYVVNQVLADSGVGSNLVPRQVTGSNRVRLTADGFKGHIASLVSEKIASGTTVSILKNDKKVAETSVSQTGDFVIADIEPGVYDLVAVGPQGIAVVAFEAGPVEVADEFRVSVSANSENAVRFAQVLEVALTNQVDDAVVNQAFDGTIRIEIVFQYPMEFAGQQMGMGIAGGPGGGGFGGGGFGGGGFGGGGLGAAGLIVGVIALATDGNGDSGPASPADP